MIYLLKSNIVNFICLQSVRHMNLKDMFVMLPRACDQSYFPLDMNKVNQSIRAAIIT